MMYNIVHIRMFMALLIINKELLFSVQKYQDANDKFVAIHYMSHFTGK